MPKYYEIEQLAEWKSKKSPTFRRGDENRPHPRYFASTRLNGKMFNMVPFNPLLPKP